jgi:hypothetical protein
VASVGIVRCHQSSRSSRTSLGEALRECTRVSLLVHCSTSLPSGMLAPCAEYGPGGRCLVLSRRWIPGALHIIVSWSRRSVRFPGWRLPDSPSVNTKERDSPRQASAQRPHTALGRRKRSGSNVTYNLLQKSFRIIGHHWLFSGKMRVQVPHKLRAKETRHT